MAIFGAKSYRSSKFKPANLEERISEFYKTQVARKPFLFFGLPFLGIIVGASFLLTPATALRYERHDQRHKQVSDSEAMEIGLKGGIGGEGSIGYNPRRRVITKGGTTERDEYYRLMAKDLDNWEQKRVERWKDEPDGRLR